MVDNIHSTGRGGAGNIGKDDNLYADGGIVREGILGESDKPEYSSGRGGAGNMVESPGSRPTKAAEDVIPELALRNDNYENFHTGRGGEGNVHREKYGGHSHEQGKESIGDKVKHILHLDKDKKHESEHKHEHDHEHHKHEHK